MILETKQLFVPAQSKNSQGSCAICRLKQVSCYGILIALLEQVFAPVKGEWQVTAKEELLSYIADLTEEQIEILFTRLGELTSSLEESSPLYPREQTLQTA